MKDFFVCFMFTFFVNKISLSFYVSEEFGLKVELILNFDKHIKAFDIAFLGSCPITCQ